MPKFMAVYVGALSPEEKAATDLSEDLQMKGMQAWAQWMEKYSDYIVDIGAPLGKTKRISPKGIESHSNKFTGYVIVKAESHAVAAEMFLNHPHFAVFPGDSVEVMECIELPRS